MSLGVDAVGVVGSSLATTVSNVVPSLFRFVIACVFTWPLLGVEDRVAFDGVVGLAFCCCCC